MQIADCFVKTDKFNEVPRHDVTPAEVQHLIRMFQPHVGSCPVGKLANIREVSRTAIAEKNRLKERYDSNPKVDKNKIEQLFPGVNPTLPTLFSEVVDPLGNKPFREDGSSTADEESLVIGGRRFTKSDVEKLIASQVVPVESSKEHVEDKEDETLI